MYNTPAYPPGTRPQSVTDQITDQKTPYCDELEYAVSNKNRMLAVIQRRDRELLRISFSIVTINLIIITAVDFRRKQIKSCI